MIWWLVSDSFNDFQPKPNQIIQFNLPKFWFAQSSDVGIRQDINPCAHLPGRSNIARCFEMQRKLSSLWDLKSIENILWDFPTGNFHHLNHRIESFKSDTAIGSVCKYAIWNAHLHFICVIHNPHLKAWVASVEVTTENSTVVSLWKKNYPPD